MQSGVLNKTGYDFFLYEKEVKKSGRAKRKTKRNSYRNIERKEN